MELRRPLNCLSNRKVTLLFRFVDVLISNVLLTSISPVHVRLGNMIQKEKIRDLSFNIKQNILIYTSFPLYILEGHYKAHDLLTCDLDLISG